MPRALALGDDERSSLSESPEHQQRRGSESTDGKSKRSREQRPAGVNNLHAHLWRGLCITSEAVLLELAQRCRKLMQRHSTT